jgi:hypothetical protein
LTGTLTIPNSVTSIGEGAFAGCSGLTGTLTIPNSLTDIGHYAFYGCSGLTELTIGNSVTDIGKGAFAGCSGLRGTLTIPNSLTHIREGVFAGCSGLTELTIGNSVTDIEHYAFYGCSGLTTLTIPNSVTSIGEEAFAYCSGLTELTIPNSVTYIGYSAFYGCTNVRKINSKNPIPPTARYDTFDGVDKGACTLYVPEGSSTTYRQAPVWKDFSHIEETVWSGIDVVKTSGRASLHIYPNPAQGDLYIQTDAPVEKVEIYTISGLRVLADEHFSGKTDVSKLSSGTYLLRVYIQGKTVSEKLIIKQ